jgi:Eco57I restriction-modification methylase
MPTLSRELRRALENVVAEARRIAEAGAEQALKQLAVHHSESWPAMTTEEKALREKLRAHGKQLGDKREASRSQEIPRLKQACAYEHWHRMLFARFLAENNLLIHPDFGEAISLEEVRELAREQNADWLSIAASFAQKMLLEVFRPDDPVLELILPPESRQKLEEKLAALPTEIFTAEDSLGWVYQFWQRDEKDAVNKSEVKIGADEISPVTQLFTEDYMVLFLLHNTLGAWWTAKQRANGKSHELADYEWTYLRLSDDGSPVAGNFDGWPQTARELRVLDPCMGSGHFLTFALPILARMRQADEGMSVPDAVHAVLAENLFGLELDARCSQIAAFNLALTAWRMVGRPMSLPSLNLACSGLGIHSSEESWLALAGENRNLRFTMAQSYKLFQKAPTLGSLIDPTRDRRAFVEFDQVWPLLEAALSAEQDTDESRELAIAAKGVLAAARILARHFTLVATNVPYLGRGKQSADLTQYCEAYYSDSKADLATCFVDRCIRFCTNGGSAALVTPQNWLFLTSYKKLRERLLRETQWDLVARLGPRAFETITGEVVNVALLGLTHRSPAAEHSFAGWDASAEVDVRAKAEGLKAPAARRLQATQLGNPGAVIAIKELSQGTRLAVYASTVEGLSTGDSDRYVLRFWEISWPNDDFEIFQRSPQDNDGDEGRDSVLRWEKGIGALARSEGARVQGQPAWGRQGVVVGQMQTLLCARSLGYKHDKITAVLVPYEERHLPALLAYCKSSEYDTDVRKINSKLNAATGVLNQVSFDLDRWEQVAGEVRDEPDHGLPTQWLSAGDPRTSQYPLHVSIARLLGYQWPRQAGLECPGYPAIEPDRLEPFSYRDGIACLASLAGEPAIADRLREVLRVAFDSEWSATKLAQLLGNSDSLESWIRDKFFEEHCGIFQNRPFIWHIWDGRKDGFHALVNYHKLTGSNDAGRKTLEKLIYTSLGDWISRQQAEVEGGVDGAEGRREAAKHLRSELINILNGEPPYDIFVRWKPLHKQPLGWEPDANDGVRLNIRPWLTAQHYRPTRREASILRVTPGIRYGKDRGKEPARDKTDFPWFAGSTDRNNDIHLSLDEKRAARERRKK